MAVESKGFLFHVPRLPEYRPFARGMNYLARTQRPDGSWLPLWFGNQHMPNDENPTYGTARVLAAYRDLAMMDTEPAQKGIAWLLANQNPDGGWGGGRGSPSSIEETALALDILCECTPHAPREDGVTRSVTTTLDPVNKGIAWLVEQIENGGLAKSAPIGFYFAKLWYFEKLYPIIFSVSALGRVRTKLRERGAN
jgi:squalene-hopene/tetraprenyl-beta-curcumene cyclase